MIEDTLAKIESAVKRVEKANPERKAELMRLLAKLKQEVRSLDAARGASVAGLTDAAAREATREGRADGPLQLSLEGLAQSVRGFESSHPKLVETVGAICRELASLGI